MTDAEIEAMKIEYELAKRKLEKVKTIIADANHELEQLDNAHFEKRLTYLEGCYLCFRSLKDRLESMIDL